jgi:assimilatory nitrate reductase catalytic subunit
MPAVPPEIRSTCCYCGVGCGVLIAAQGEQILGVRGDPEHPANFGRLCSKGNTLHRTATAAITAQARLLQPMRRAARSQEPQPVSWDAALDEAAARLHAIAGAHGPDALGFYVSGQFLTEDYYVFNKLAKGLLQTNNIDSNSRLCMSSAVAGYKATLGADAPPACYADIDRATTLFIVGANMAFAHPVLFRRIEDARRANPQLRIIVADPRRTDTAQAADLFLPLAPGTDVVLFHGMLHVLLWDGLLDAAFIENHTSGFAALKERVREFTPREAARVCGIPEADLVQAAHWFGQKGVAGGASLSLYCQGLNQSADGTSKNAALINLHLATGQIGKPGAGPLSLTGQPNAMGGREVGAMATLASGHRELDDPEHRVQIARLWNVETVPARPGKTAVEMFEAAASGQIKALWIACTNPAQSLPDQALVRRALERVEFLVVQEAFAGTETARYADLLLPAASWGEKEGTVTNSERRISRVRRAVAPPGQARPDWAIGVALAQRIEALRQPGEPSRFAYASAEAVWNEHRETTRGRDLDITGLSYSLLDAAGPQQWPFVAATGAGLERLYADGVFPTADGRARFADVPYRPLAEPRDVRYPFSLLTGRLRDQWHGMSRTGTVGQLFGHDPEPVIELHPRDMERLALADGDLVHVTSRRGSLVVAARGSDTLARTQAFLAMHWGDEFLGGTTRAGERAGGVNALTLPQSCPTSRQPELKHTAVKILRAELPWRLMAMAWLLPERAVQARRQLRELLGGFAYAVSVPFGSDRDGTDRQGVLVRAAGLEAPLPEMLEAVERLLDLAGADVLRYADRRHGRWRSMRLCDAAQGKRLEGFLLAGDTSSGAWIRELLEQQLPAQAYGRMLLRPGSAAPAELAVRSPQVCSCFGVSAAQIDAKLAQIAGADAGVAPEEQLRLMQAELRCGTNCGSCLPELRQRVGRVARERRAAGAVPVTPG